MDLQNGKTMASEPTFYLKLARFMRISSQRQRELNSRRMIVRIVVPQTRKGYESLTEYLELATTFMGCTRAELEKGSDEALADGLEIELARMIFGSNFIEGAGADFEETLALSKEVFRGKDIIESLQEAGGDYDRLEVVQHARALKFFLQKFCLDNLDLTEDLILQTHKILCEGRDHDDGTAWEQWAGKYRDCEIAASSIDKDTAKRIKSVFIRASSVPSYTVNLVRAFNSWASEQGHEADPFELASWLCTQFVNIHPFADGNGRMCRILLNGVLFKHAGLIACIGEDGSEGKDQYLEIARMSNKKYHEEDCEIRVENQTSHLALTKVVVKRVSECGERMLERLRIVGRSLVEQPH
ncbi:hypothetical protein TWF694_006378 [Orbilia ellipsospora]|uniref:Fido domain-containing protein n=1 Tax=Orbilia ellipsospora TaxID=2528407 RepID=A0AAV9XK04_9PEZI